MMREEASEESKDSDGDGQRPVPVNYNSQDPATYLSFIAIQKYFTILPWFGVEVWYEKHTEKQHSDESQTQRETQVRLQHLSMKNALDMNYAGLTKYEKIAAIDPIIAVQ